MLPFLLTLLGLIVAHVLLSTSIAIFITKDFQWQKLPEFLTYYVPKLLGWIALEAFAFVPPDVLTNIPGGEATILFTSGFSKVVFGVIALGILSKIFIALNTIGIIPTSLEVPLNRTGFVPRSVTYVPPVKKETPNG